MRLKVLIRLVVAALLLMPLCYLLIVCTVHHEEQKMMADARLLAHTINNTADDATLNDLTDSIYQKLSDSMQDAVILDFPGKYTYRSAKAKEINLWNNNKSVLKLILEVGIDDMVRNMSNSPDDALLDKAIADANKAKAGGGDFITLFGQAYEKMNPSGSMAALFTKPSEKDLFAGSTNADVLKKLRVEARNAIIRTYEVLKARVNNYGVSESNITVDKDRGIITMELVGIHDIDRFYSYLITKGRLQFFETYTNQEIVPMLESANNALAIHLYGKAGENTDADTVKKDDVPHHKPDTANLTALINKSHSVAEDDARKKPLLSVLSPYKDQQTILTTSPVIGFVAKKNVEKYNKYFAMDIVKNKFPADVHFCFGQLQKFENNPNTVYEVYALKMPPDGIATIEGDCLTNADAHRNKYTGEPCVYMEMNDDCAQKWQYMTGHNIDRYIALTMDDVVFSCPQVRSEISVPSTEISGSFTTSQAQDLANLLKSGVLSVPIHVLLRQHIGASVYHVDNTRWVQSLEAVLVVISVLLLLFFFSGKLFGERRLWGGK